MLSIILANIGLWVNIMIPVILGIYLLVKRPGEFVLKEFGAQVLLTTIILGLVYTILFRTQFDLIGHEQHNGFVSKFEHDEEWDERVTYTEEECSGSGAKRTCRTVTKTRIDHHPDVYTAFVDNGDSVSLSADEFNAAKNKFGFVEVDVYHSNQVSIGDGNKFIVAPNELITASVTHEYVNYVTAAKDNVVYQSVPQKTIEEYTKKGSIVPRPTTHGTTFGEFGFDRVIWTGSNTNNGLETRIEKELDFVAGSLGTMKQVNPIIYITDETRQFVPALKSAWKMGAKNDAIVVLNVDKNGTILWSDAIAWSKDSMFQTVIRNEYPGKNINSPEFVKKVSSDIFTHYKRKPMSDFEYLKENITLSIWWQMGILIVNLLGSFFLARYFIESRDLH